MDHSYSCADCAMYVLDILYVCTGSKSHAIVLNCTLHGPETSAMDPIYCCADYYVPLLKVLPIYSGSSIRTVRLLLVELPHSDTTAVTV